MKKLFWLVVLLAVPAYSQRNFDNVEVKAAPVQGNIYVLTGSGGNTTVQAGPDGVLVVDTMFAPLGPKILGSNVIVGGDISQSPGSPHTTQTAVARSKECSPA